MHEYDQDYDRGDVTIPQYMARSSYHYQPHWPSAKWGCNLYIYLGMVAGGVAWYFLGKLIAYWCL